MNFILFCIAYSEENIKQILNALIFFFANLFFLDFIHLIYFSIKDGYCLISGCLNVDLKPGICDVKAPGLLPLIHQKHV